MSTSATFLFTHLVGVNQGIYIPQIFAQKYGDLATGILRTDILTLQQGPENSAYWDVWTAVLNDCTLLMDSIPFRLAQIDGGLFAYPEAIEALINWGDYL